VELLGKHLLVLDQGERHRVIAFAVLFIFIAVAIPIGLSIYLVRDQGLETEKARALNYASDALRRSEITFDQISLAFEELKSTAGRKGCSPTQIATMRERDLASSYIQAIGHVQAGVLVCSSLGSELRGMDLGPVDLVQGSRLRVRTHVKFPFAPDERFIVLEQDGYAAIIHRDLPIDATTDVEGVSFAVTFIPSSFVLTSRGKLKDQWLQPLARGVRKTMLDDDYVVAVATSARHSLQAVAAVPSSHLQHRLGRYALVLVPIGFLVASLTGAAALFLARRRTSMRAVMNSALRRNEFFLEYQPIVDLRTRRWVGAEALMRWRRMEGETVAPDRFIPIAEANGLAQWLSCRAVELVARDAPIFSGSFRIFVYPSI
jgi:sensor c-di-GMP phosphodiesterase-like protein